MGGARAHHLTNGDTVCASHNVRGRLLTLVHKARGSGRNVLRSRRLLILTRVKDDPVEEIELFEAHLSSAKWHVVERHFRQAKTALDRGDWEAANAQTRAFLDALCEEIAGRVRKAGHPYPRPAPKGGDARMHLQQTGFLDVDESHLLKAFFKVLHGKGSHPGTSNTEDATRRFVMATCLANYYVERLHEWQEAERADLFRLEHFAETVLGPRGSVSVLFEYKSLDFDTVHIEGEDVVFETEKAYGKASALHDQWIDEFEEALIDGGMGYAIVVTEDVVQTQSQHVTKHSDGIYLAYNRRVVIVEVPPDNYDEAAAERIRKARRLLAARIRKDHRQKESDGSKSVITTDAASAQSNAGE